MRTDILLRRIEAARKSMHSNDSNALDLFIERTFASDNLLKFVEKNTKDREVILEVRRHLLVTYVSSMEAYFKNSLGYLLDSRKVEETNRRKLLKSLGNVTFSLDNLLEIQKRDFSLGEIVVQTRSFQNLESINQVYSDLFGVKDFIGEVESLEIKDWGMLIKRDFPDLRDEVAEMIRLRHLIIHNTFAVEKIGREKVRRLCGYMTALVLVTDYYIWEKLN